jgi:hypothetical protein
MRKWRGVTFVELLIYCVLLLLIIAAVYASFSIARDYYAAAQIETEAQQAAIDASLGVSQELAHAARNSIVLSESPAGVVFLSAKTDQGPFLHDQTTGALLWQRWVCIYLDTGTHELKRVERLLSAPVADIPGTTPTAGELLSDNTLGHYVLGRNVTEFTRGITVDSTVWFQVRSSLTPSRMASGQAQRAGEDATTQIVLATEVPIRQ